MTLNLILSHILYLLIPAISLFTVSCAGVPFHQRQELAREAKAPYAVQEDLLVDLKSPELPQKLDFLDVSHLDLELPCSRMMPIIPFSFDQATLTTEAIEGLEYIGRFMRYCPDHVFDVEGHTDWEGDEDYNVGLANRRTRAVIYYLIYEQGVEAERLVSAEKLSQGILAGESYGEFVPIARNDTDEGRAYNRRVEFSKIAKQE